MQNRVHEPASRPADGLRSIAPQRARRTLLAVVVSTVVAAALAPVANAGIWAPLPSGTSADITAVSYRGPDKLFFGTADGELRRERADGSGSTVVAQSPGTRFRRIAFAPGGALGLAVGSGGTVLRTADGGATWSQVGQLTTYDDGDLGAVGRTDYCNAPRPNARSKPLTIELSGVSWQNDSTAYVVGSDAPYNNGGMDGNGQGVVQKTTDGGLSFTEVGRAGSAQCRINGYVSDVQSLPGSAITYFVTLGAYLFRTTDGLATSIPAYGEPFICAKTPRVAFDPSVPAVLYAGDTCDGAYYTSTDGGLTWHGFELPAPPLPGAHDVATDGGAALFVGEDGSIIRTIDQGHHAQSYPADGALAGNEWWAVGMVSASDAVVGGQGGALVTTHVFDAPSTDSTTPTQLGVASPLAIRAIAAQQLSGSGGSTMLTAQVDGSPAKLAWDLNSDGRSDATCDGDQDSLRLSPLSKALTSVILTAIGADGQTVSQVQKLDPAKSTLHGSAPGKLDKLPPAAACGDGVTFAKADTSAKTSAVCSILTTAISAQLEATGCLRKITSIGQVPAPERGILQIAANKLALKPTQTLVTSALTFSDAYVATGAITLNGLDITPKRGAAIVFWPQLKMLASSDATLGVGGVKLADRRNFVLDLTPHNGSIDLGVFPRLAGSVTSLAGFRLAGDVAVRLTGPPDLLAPSNQPARRPGATVTTRLQLPQDFTAAGAPAEGPVTFQSDNDRGLALDGATFGPVDGDLGALAFRSMKLSYTSAAKQWTGPVTLCHESLCLTPTNLPAQVAFINGRFAGGRMMAARLAVAPGVTLTGADYRIATGPVRLTGPAKLSASGIVDVDGDSAFAFPTSDDPYRLGSSGIGGLPTDIAARTVTTPTIALGGRGSVIAPIVNRIGIGNAHIVYSFPSSASFGGEVREDLFGVVSLDGRLEGDLNAQHAQFNLVGTLHACVAKLICGTATGVLSSEGAGACVNVDVGVGDVNIGGGVRFHPYDVILWPLDGCRWSRFKAVVKASGAQVGTPYVVNVRAGDRSRAIRLDGAGGEAPGVHVAGPGGVSLDSAPGGGLTAAKGVRIIRAPELARTVVGLQTPAPGRYVITPLAGSRITRVTSAEDQRPASIHAKLTARGSQRTLRYELGRRAGQQVTFLERGPQGPRVLGRTSASGAGRLTFTPVPGSGPRSIVARFTLDGLPAESVKVATYRPPSPRLPAPRALRASRSGNAVRASWAAVAGATRYRLTLTPRSGSQRVLTVRGHTTSLRVPATVAGKIAVSAVAPLRAGPAAHAAFAASAKRTGRFAPLPRSSRL